MALHDNQITFEEGAEMTARYRLSMTTGQIKGGFFTKEAIQTLLNQPYSIGMRFYYGLDDEDKQTLILVAVDEDGNDLVEPGNVCYDRSISCPTVCGNDNMLNSDEE